MRSADFDINQIAYSNLMETRPSVSRGLRSCRKSVKYSTPIRWLCYMHGLQSCSISDLAWRVSERSENCWRWLFNHTYCRSTVGVPAARSARRIRSLNWTTAEVDGPQVELYALGVGQDVDVDELTVIASPLPHHVLLMKNVETFELFSRDLLSGVSSRHPNWSNPLFDNFHEVQHGALRSLPSVLWRCWLGDFKTPLVMSWRFFGGFGPVPWEERSSETDNPGETG